MAKYEIIGGTPLKGEVVISGAKNAVVAILPATLLVPGKCRINLTTLDDLLFEKNHQIGLIKADIEGMGAEMLTGAKKIITRDHPVLALSCYHSPEELFGQDLWLKNNFQFYRLSFTALPPGSGWELTMIGIPGELL